MPSIPSPIEVEYLHGNYESNQPGSSPSRGPAICPKFVFRTRHHWLTSDPMHVIIGCARISILIKPPTNRVTNEICTRGVLSRAKCTDRGTPIAGGLGGGGGVNPPRYPKSMFAGLLRS